jgi:DNA-directed RNA polymerase subunit RPC12/RpoP
MEVVLICLALGVAVTGGIAFFGRCKVCGSINHAFSQDHAADLSEGKAYIVCKRCGDRQYKGDVSADGSVVWMSGGSGKFHEDGSYTGDSGTFMDGGGGDGGGGGGGE